MIIEVQNKYHLNQFVYFIQRLYKDYPHYVFPIFKSQMRELKEEVLISKRYTAILSSHNGEIVGRLLFTFQFSEKHQKNICYFSFFDVIDDLSVAKELFDYMDKTMLSAGIYYSEGTFSPYDPDTRRGILIDGFEDDPMLLTSYNAPYYSHLIEKIGFQKAYDTHSITADFTPDNEKRLNALASFFDRHYDIRVDDLNMKKLDHEIHDIHKILLIATTDLNYQEAPSIEMIEKVARNMKMLINPKLIKIARENKTNEPIGFCLILPDFNQILKLTQGKLKPIVFLKNRGKINRARATMQYIIPKYQSTGLIGYMYKYVFESFKSMGITYFEGGTILEDNLKSLHAFDKFGGRIIKTFRIYGKEITV
jgi:hypothetical protein